MGTAHSDGRFALQCTSSVGARAGVRQAMGTHAAMGISPRRGLAR